jgi:23S rRNA-/tRNA-specific pseudouridylate synthase
MQILFSNQFLIAIDKPSGIAVHGAPGPGASLLKELREHFSAPELTPVHRIDKDASGVLLFARDKKCAAGIQRHWDQVKKEYRVICDGIPPDAEGLIDALILENPSDKPERMAGAVRYFGEQHPGVELPPLPAPKRSAVHPAGRASQTRYVVEETFANRWSLLRVSPQQGRMHQIRVHLAHAGFPLAVDPLYNSSRENAASQILENGEPLFARLPLHAATLALPAIPFITAAIRIEAPLAGDLVRATRRLAALPA